ncbi:hypothetical protein GHT06_020683 [Daphnia sinensis]|uniref:Uncharacterized protein n=1 Tax=Daphnia sinensis TaxID=1820382 RepID=A0AAD5KZB6_9CRUS|nr:hypothetical protein GHT06_020683 [Daphnia sinensis]
MNSPIPKLPGAKKQFAHVQSKVDCRRPAVPSAAAPGKLIQENQKSKTSPIVTGAKSSKPTPVPELVKPFRANPVPKSHYAQPFRPVLKRKSPINEAPKAMEVPPVAVPAVPSQDAVEEVPDVAVEVPVVEDAPSENAADVIPVADEVVEVPAVVEVVEVPAVVEVVEVPAVVEVVEVPAVVEVAEVAPALEAVEVDAAQVIEDLPVVAEVAEAAEEDEVVPPVVASAAEDTVPSDVAPVKKKRSRRKKKTSDVPPAPEAAPVAPPGYDEAWFAQLTAKQRRNIYTNKKRSAAWRAQREALGPDAHIFLPPRITRAPLILAPKEVDVVHA